MTDPIAGRQPPRSLVRPRHSRSPRLNRTARLLQLILVMAERFGSSDRRREDTVRASYKGRGAGPRARESDTADLGILRRMAAGNPDALAELYDRHAVFVYSHALRILRQQEDA